MHGTSPAGAEMVLAELRRSLREGGTKSARFDDPARLFFQPIEPFLVDDGPDHKHRGRIARSALEPLWLWIGNTLMPEEAKAYSEQVEQRADGRRHRPGRASGARRSRIAWWPASRRCSESADDKERRRLERAARHLARARRRAGAARHSQFARRLAMLGCATAGPHQFADRAGAGKRQGAWSIRPQRAKSDLLLYSLVLVMSKLASPWQLIRLATKAAGSDDAKRIAETPYAVAVQIVLEEVDRRVRELATDLKSGRGIAVVGAAQRGPRRAARVALGDRAVGGSRPGASSSPRMRADVSKILTAEIELMPGRVRRLIRPRPAKEIAPGSRLDADEVTETEALIGFVAACRNYASELAVNEVTQRTFNELQQFLDSGTRTLARRAARREHRRAAVPPVADRCRGPVLRQGVRPGICLAAGQGRRGRLARPRAQGGSQRQPAPEAAVEPTITTILRPRSGAVSWTLPAPNCILSAADRDVTLRHDALVCHGADDGRRDLRGAVAACAGARGSRAGSDVAVYRDQLEEIARDRAGGLIGEREAEAARIEVSRRLLAAADTDAPAPQPASAGAARRRRGARGA